ncbi:MAG: diphosphomevalonate decarboxylase [Acidobacteriota bacterium]
MSEPLKVTVSAPSNIALIKYWGARDLQRVIPWNPSISMTLETCRTTTTAAWEPEGADDGEGDEIWWVDDNGELVPPGEAFVARAQSHLDRLRRWAADAPRAVSGRLRIATRNSFPSAAGIASSASGFAALTLATVRALGAKATPRQLSNLARASGSGSASRSTAGGFVEWPGSQAPADDPWAEAIAPADHWALRDLVAVVETGPKGVSSLDGHLQAESSPHFAQRLRQLPRRLEEVRRGIRERDIERLGPVVEEEAHELHLIAMSSRPPIHYWTPGTVEVLAAVRAMRRDLGLPVWATMDAGANVHVLCPPGYDGEATARLTALPAVRQVLRDRCGTGPRGHEEHLF